jgi:NAD(P)-dependent dehydrogenase (short-subunit alcohol dehydrogenase family)
MKAQRIEGEIALVTGANRGIGRALTEALLARGVRKIGTADRRNDRGDALGLRGVSRTSTAPGMTKNAR